MTTLSPLNVILIGIIILLAALIFFTLPRRREAAELRAAIIRMDARLEQTQALDTQRGRDTEDQLRDLERTLRGLHATLSQQLEQRIGDLKFQQLEKAGEAKTAVVERLEGLQGAIATQLGNGHAHTVRGLAELKQAIAQGLSEDRRRFEQRQGEALKALQETLHDGIATVQRQVGEALSRSSNELGKRVGELTKTTEERLKDIGRHVDRRLNEGFEKTTATFADVLKRLALIDEAQKRITELSVNVVSLQEVLADKRSRGAFGEVQLAGLVRNMLPESNFALQHTLSNQRVADCVMFLPTPTGNVAIDAKFPLESYHRMYDTDAAESDRRAAGKQFKIDIRKHIQDIAERYIIPNETSDGAVMFIPAEAVFAEIQAHHPDLVERSQIARVWMVSPTTLMAILNTARAVLKDAATREQVHIIQKHLTELGRDFSRFQKRMDSLSRHIQQVGKDVAEVHTSARKITSRFERIESADLSSADGDEDSDRRLPAPESSTVTTRQGGSTNVR